MLARALSVISVTMQTTVTCNGMKSGRNDGAQNAARKVDSYIPVGTEEERVAVNGLRRPRSTIRKVWHRTTSEREQFPTQRWPETVIKI
jgi:hypothetical protein